MDVGACGYLLKEELQGVHKLLQFAIAFRTNERLEFVVSHRHAEVGNPAPSAKGRNGDQQLI